MKKWVKEPAFAVLRVLALFGATSLACSSPPQGATMWSSDPPATDEERPPLDPLKPGTTILCDAPALGDQSGGTGFYVLSAMNHKLRHFPDFAGEIGLDMVSDCESADRFLRGYAEYAREHPAFDADEPLAPFSDEEEPELPPLEPDDGADDETQKIANSPAKFNNPVVQLSFTTCWKKGCPRADNTWVTGVPPSGTTDMRRSTTSCSGTFIAKNWILTAAHCLTRVAIDTCMEDGVPRLLCGPKWNNYGRWRIRGTFSAGLGSDDVPSDDDRRAFYDRNVMARGYVQTNWVGRNLLENFETCELPGCYNADAFAEHDLALLYISPAYDDVLPPRVEDDAAKRLSIVPFNAGWSLAVAGWGLPGGTNTLRQTTASLGSMVAVGSRLDVTTTGTQYTCPGDSGGPVLRAGLTMNTNFGQQVGLEAIVAVNSGSSAGCNPVSPPGTTVAWNATLVHTEAHRNFIRDTFRLWPQYRHFGATERVLVPSPTGRPEVEEHWGKSCTRDGPPCATSEVCLNPAREVARRSPACVACADFDEPLDNACDCIFGQCLPK